MLVSFALTLLTTLLAGVERLQAGRTAQGILFFTGAAVGLFVYLRRRRREARAGASAGPATADEERVDEA